MGLDDPTRKMSKSEANEGHPINLLDSPDSIRAKIARAKTDSGREIRFDNSRPGITNLLTIYQLFSGMDQAAIEARFAGKGYADFKKELAGVIVEHLKPLQSRYREIAAEPGYIDHLLEEGSVKARPIAERTLRLVKDRIGLG